jgi:hypothetical protein
LKISAEMARATVLAIRTAKYELEFIDEPLYSRGSADNVRSYSREYDFDNDSRYRPTNRHGLVLREAGVLKESCILLAGGGTSGLHEHSAVAVDDACYIAVGDTLCSLALPSLELRWHRKVDTATCFGIYYSAKHQCLISHGELEIARISLAGDVAWSSGGEDIFSEGFELHTDYVEARDFNGAVYRLDIVTGRSPK